MRNVEDKESSLQRTEFVSEDMDLAQIAESGQCFTWERLKDGGYGITALGRYVEARQDGSRFILSCGPAEFQEVWKDYFDLDRDYGALKRLVDPKDAYLTAAVEHGWGIRVLRQDLWEVMLGFLISQNNNITRIRRSLRALCETCGGRIPTPWELRDVTEEAFAEAGLGYRAKYLKALVERINEESAGGIQEPPLFASLRQADYGMARELLLSLYGIGGKVADCICLFGLNHVDAFPVDTHIKKILKAHYPEGFPYERYYGFAGILQQYLFFYDLK